MLFCIIYSFILLKKCKKPVKNKKFPRKIRGNLENSLLFFFFLFVASLAIAVAISFKAARRLSFFTVYDDVHNRKHNPQRKRDY